MWLSTELHKDRGECHVDGDILVESDEILAASVLAAAKAGFDASPAHFLQCVGTISPGSPWVGLPLPHAAHRGPLRKMEAKSEGLAGSIERVLRGVENERGDPKFASV